MIPRVGTTQDIYFSALQISGGPERGWTARLWSCAERFEMYKGCLDRNPDRGLASGSKRTDLY